MKRLTCNVGDKFGRWTVVEMLGVIRHGNTRRTCVAVRCECGAEAVRPITELSRSKSCGCLGADVTRERQAINGGDTRTHGMTKTREYTSWYAAIMRCTNEHDTNWKHYGGRGITMCAGWSGSFAEFFADMGRRPENTSIDRIDNDKGYWCGRCFECVSLGRAANCRWATPSEQARNTRATRLLTHNGQTMPLPDWARVIGVHPVTLINRLRRGWQLNEALSVPKCAPGLAKSPRASRVVEWNGRTIGATRLAREIGMRPRLLVRRLAAGWTVSDAISRPVRNVGT